MDPYSVNHDSYVFEGEETPLMDLDSSEPLDNAPYSVKFKFFFKENWRYILIIIGGFFASLIAGSTNAFNIFATEIQTSDNVSDNEINLIAGLGLIGIYFMLPAGWVLDRYGPVLTAVIGSLMAVAGYLGMSFAPSGAWWVILLGLTVVGFGSGAVFLAVLGTSISCSPSGGGWGVSIVSAGMSLSIAFVIRYTKIFLNVIDCHGPHCWKSSFRAIAIAAAVLMLPGSALMCLFRREDYPHLIDTEEFETHIGSEIEGHKCEDRTPDDDPRRKQVTLWESLLIVLQSPLFWALFISFFSGIAASVFVLTQTAQFWESYNENKDLDHWGSLILTIFSFCNAGANICNGVLSDYLSKNQIMSHHTFLALTLLLFSFVFTVIGVLVQLNVQTVFTAILLAFVGGGFGTYLVLFPIVIAEIYGPANFGKYFGYLEIASSIASLSIPQLATTVFHETHNYVIFFYALAGLQFIASLFMFLKTFLHHVFHFELK